MPAKTELSDLKGKEEKIFCKICGVKAVKNGLYKASGKQRYRCQSCKKSFVAHSRDFSTKESIHSIYEEFLNADEPNIKSFAAAHDYKRSTLYQHFNIAGIKNVKITKILCNSVLSMITNNTDALIVREIKFVIFPGGVRLILDGQAVIDDEILFEFREIQNRHQKYNCNKVLMGGFELIITGQPLDIADYLKRFELTWVVLSTEEFRLRKRKSKIVHK